MSKIIKYDLYGPNLKLLNISLIDRPDLFIFMHNKPYSPAPQEIFRTRKQISDVITGK